MAPDSLTVRLLFLARYGELAGRESAQVVVPAPATVQHVLAAMRSQLPATRTLPERVLCALNLRQVDPAEPVADGDELALLPPLAGG